MPMTHDNFLEKLKNSPELLEFTDTMALIDALYEFTPTAFQNGEQYNEAGQNNGSCKLFAFAKLQGFTESQTLACFGAFYRDDVLKHPEATDHQNIRNFMKSGWAGVRFEGEALSPRA